ncbi:MAG: hypothetical protein HN600_15185 [Bacteroidetes bacterium]|jgi:hypothetical protein|nr:hypothetical protein [Cytophagia bacterium]MBT7827930.1 hypothetical protein [Bacteroidota bacterium]
MTEKYLFIKSTEDKRIYNLNQGYWKRKLQSRLKEKFSEENVLFKNIDTKGKKIYDANPIFTFIDYQKTKAIRIIQDDIKQIEQENIEMEKYLISAWFDKISIYEKNNIDSSEKNVNELVIALFLTRSTVEKTMNLIYKWLNNDLTNENIERIINE